MGIIDRAIASSVPAIPRPIVRRISGRYMAGECLEDAVKTIRDLNCKAARRTVDVLGETTQSERDATEKLKHYKQIVDALDEHALKSGLSVKLTGLGMDLDEEVCRRNLEEIVEYAARDRFVRVDMEDSSHTVATLELALEMHERHKKITAHQGGRPWVCRRTRTSRTWTERTSRAGRQCEPPSKRSGTL